MNWPAELQGRFEFLGLLLVFALLLPAPARAQHIHVQLSYSAATQWRLFIYDFDSGEFDPTDVPFFTGHQAFSFVPANSFTNFLGPAGGGVWTLPETENGELLYLGIGTQGIAPGTFVNNQIRLHLRSLSGPGYFALYNVDPFGTPIVHMNSRDGIDPATDSVAIAASGGHIHVNWAFSAPGTYRVGLGASGRLANGQTSTSPVVEYTFLVQDVPWRPRLEIASGPGATNITLRLQAEPGRACRIESSADLIHWETLTNLVTTSSVTTFQVSATNQSVRAFRALLPPP